MNPCLIDNFTFLTLRDFLICKTILALREEYEGTRNKVTQWNSASRDELHIVRAD